MFPDLSGRGILVKARESLERVRAGASKETMKETDELLGRLEVKTEPSFAVRSGSEEVARFEQQMGRLDAELDEFLKGKDQKILAEAQASIEKQFGKG